MMRVSAAFVVAVMVVAMSMPVPSAMAMAGVDPAAQAAAAASIDAQVEAQLSKEDAQPPTGSQFLPASMRFHATQNEVVSALNSLDIKAGAAPEAKPAEPTKHKAAVVSAFASIALETMHRATGAIHWLRQRAYALGQKVKVDAHHYKDWMDAHRKHAAAQITAEVERLGSLSDEVAHLKQVMQDAISKDRSYTVQINELVSERQLQRTPPVMPAVVAAGLSDEQFQAATAKLHAFRAKAQQVIQQTSGGIHQREHLMEQGTKWIEDSKLVLSKWYTHQTTVYNQLVANGKKAVLEATRRVEAVERIQADAKKFHRDYLNALQRLHLEARIAVLRESEKHHSALKAADEYEEARVKSFVAALRLEIAGLEAKLKKIPGDGKVVPPPAVWGVLAQYQAFAVHVPHIAPPTYGSVVGMAPSVAFYGHGMAYHQAVNPGAHPAVTAPGPVDPSITSSVPTQAEATALRDPGATWDLGIGSAVGEAPYNPWTSPSPAAESVAKAAAAGAEASASAGSSSSGSAAAFLEEMGRALQQQQQPQQQPPQQQQQQFRAPQVAVAGGVPVMPDLPEPPRMTDFI